MEVHLRNSEFYLDNNCQVELRVCERVVVLSWVGAKCDWERGAWRKAARSPWNGPTSSFPSGRVEFAPASATSPSENSGTRAFTVSGGPAVEHSSSSTQLSSKRERESKRIVNRESWCAIDLVSRRRARFTPIDHHLLVQKKMREWERENACIEDRSGAPDF